MSKLVLRGRGLGECDAVNPGTLEDPEKQSYLAGTLSIVIHDQEMPFGDNSHIKIRPLRVRVKI